MAEDEKTAEAVESAPSSDSKATETEKVVEASKEGKGNSIPQSRLKEVVDQRDAISEKFDALETQYSNSQNELSTMIELLRTREDDVNIVQRIRQMGADPKWKDIVQKLDAGLQGKDTEEEEETDEKSDDKSTQVKADRKTEKLITETREALEEQLADQKADALFTKADLLAERYFDALPEEYTDNDKKLIGELLIDRVAWESIEDNSDSLVEEVAKGFEKTLEAYGKPRGTVAEKEETETETTETKDSESETSEQFAKEWGELKEVKLPDGKTTIQPVVSEHDFTKELANALRRDHSRV